MRKKIFYIFALISLWIQSCQYPDNETIFDEYGVGNHPDTSAGIDHPDIIHKDTIHLAMMLDYEVDDITAIRLLGRFNFDRLHKFNVLETGFVYRKIGEDDWTKVVNLYDVEGNIMDTIRGFELGVYYEYALFLEDVYSVFDYSDTAFMQTPSLNFTVMDPTEVADSSANFQGSFVTDNLAIDSVAVSMQLAMKRDDIYTPDHRLEYACEVDSLGKFSAMADSLLPTTEYYYRAVMQYRGYEFGTDIRSFVTEQ